MPQRAKKSLRRIKTIKTAKPEVFSSETFEDIQVEKRPISIKQIAFGLGLVLLVLLIYYYKNLFLVALVNGQPISRLSVIRELEKRSGKQELDNLVTEALIFQEAQKQKAIISQDEINSELAKIEESLKKQNLQLDQALKTQGLTKDDLVKQIKIQKSIEKMLDVKVTDEDIDKYLEANKDSLPKNPTQDQLKEIRQNVKQQLIQQKLAEKFQTWITELKDKAKINYFLNY